MVTLLLAASIIAIMFVVGILLISIGGSIFFILGADIIVAGFVIWLIAKAFSKKKKN